MTQAIKRISTGALAAVLITACAPKAPGSGGSGRPSSMPGGVYRTSAKGEAVGSEKGPGGGGAKSGLNPLLVGGLITLGVSYGLTVIGGQVVAGTLDPINVPNDALAQVSIDKLWVPVFGAWAGFFHNIDYVEPGCDYCDEAVAGSAGMLVGAIAQTTGIGLTVVGAIREATRRGGGGGGGGGPSRMTILPVGNAHGGGLAIGGAF